MIEKTFSASVDLLPEVLAMVEEEMEKAEYTMKTTIQTTIAAEEIFVNIANYAYPEGGGEMQLSIDVDEEKMTICFVDKGIPFDPLAKEDPDITLSAEERGIGGLGIFMVKSYMDTVSYRREDGKNIFTVTRNRE